MWQNQVYPVIRAVYAECDGVGWDAMLLFPGVKFSPVLLPLSSAALQQGKLG